ncbi:hypothetical protein EDB81DRAFT_895743 [Dactylonectria macrodidyma]|uniref:Uncharacterized protein n=1 Tax=Dactylonectria macrodidyma TaxID=307937 RepID=A0A9P9FTU5_9HYPO|nr:hypothetical protein EDB81DRAFT_895743 [Dactylonectria macrodidyma]
MASTKSKLLTYHVVPRFDIAAVGGALQLGTVIEDLNNVRPVNHGHVIPIPDNVPYESTTGAGFHESHSRLLGGHAGIWARALVLLQTGAPTEASAQSDIQVAVRCEGVTTSYFDPDASYVDQSLSAPCVNDYFTATDYKADVFLVTGLKVAKKLQYTSIDSSQKKANAQIGVLEPNTIVQLGASVGGSASNEHNISFDVKDIVIGLRVRRYAYVRASRNPFSNKKVLEGSDYLEGAEMFEEGGAVRMPQATYKQVVIQEEEEAQKAAEARGELVECWVALPQ